MTRITTSIDTTATIERIKEIIGEQPQPIDRDALRRALTAENHDPRAIDLALAQIYGYEVEGIPFQSGTPPMSSVVIVLVALTIIFANSILIVALVAAMLNVLSRYSYALMPVAIMVPFVSVLGIEGAMLPRLQRRDPARALGLAFGMGVSVVVACFSLVPLLNFVSLFR
jgi:hypothetical protein